ncbi:MAG: hypothetical protein MJY50_03910 [Bacteroidales bacterium]|nr:hypothetical protein [Bacteroidales bacterium]
MPLVVRIAHFSGTAADAAIAALRLQRASQARPFVLYSRRPREKARR